MKSYECPATIARGLNLLLMSELSDIPNPTPQQIADKVNDLQRVWARIGEVAVSITQQANDQNVPTLQVLGSVVKAGMQLGEWNARGVTHIRIDGKNCYGFLKFESGLGLLSINSNSAIFAAAKVVENAGQFILSYGSRPDQPPVLVLKPSDGTIN